MSGSINLKAAQHRLHLTPLHIAPIVVIYVNTKTAPRLAICANAAQVKHNRWADAPLGKVNMPEYHYRFICTKCGEKLAWEGSDYDDDFYIEPCQTCLQEAAQQSVQADGAFCACVENWSLDAHGNCSNCDLPRRR